MCMHAKLQAMCISRFRCISPTRQLCTYTLDPGFAGGPRCGSTICGLSQAAPAKRVLLAEFVLTMGYILTWLHAEHMTNEASRASLATSCLKDKATRPATNAQVVLKGATSKVVACLGHGGRLFHSVLQSCQAFSCLALSESACTFDCLTTRRQTDTSSQISAASPSDCLHCSSAPERPSAGLTQGALPLFAACHGVPLGLAIQLTTYACRRKKVTPPLSLNLCYGHLYWDLGLELFSKPLTSLGRFVLSDIPNRVKQCRIVLYGGKLFDRHNSVHTPVHARFIASLQFAICLAGN